MKVGFTGTRDGLTEEQRHALLALLTALVPTEGHHGDCVGADAEFHALVRLAYPLVRRAIHPPIEESLRAFCVGEETRPPLTHFARNRNIVDETDLLLAAPKQMAEQNFGGTWYTVKYARKRGKEVRIIWPDGSVTMHQGNKEA